LFLQEPHDVTSQKTAFIVIAMETSDLTYSICLTRKWEAARAKKQVYEEWRLVSKSKCAAAG
jgi:hypothetical protein